MIFYIDWLKSIKNTVTNSNVNKFNQMNWINKL